MSEKSLFRGRLLVSLAFAVLFGGVSVVAMVGIRTLPAAASATPEPSPGDRCDELAGILGGASTVTGEVCRIAFPRSDLEVRLLGATLPPSMGLTSWAAFSPAGERGSIVMGDLALTSAELPRIMTGLRENGILVTAVHRHMLGESPPMSFMHYLGVGADVELARGLRAAMDRAPTSRGAANPNSPEPPGATRTGREGIVAGAACDSIARVLDTDPTTAARGPGYCKVSRPRSGLDVQVHGIPVSAASGIGSWFAFRETDSGTAAVVTGDMALTEEQVNPAIRVLRASGIDVAALHNHMLFEQPGVMFFHFQGRESPLELANGLRAGLDAAGLTKRRGR